MNDEQLRAEFEAWLYLDQTKYDPERMSKQEIEIAKLAYQAGRAALQSQDREDAERYRFIRAKVYASNAYGRASWKFHYDNLPLPLDNPTRGSVKQHFEDAIDHARREDEGRRHVSSTAVDDQFLPDEPVKEQP